MIGLLLALIYISFISLGLPDAVLGSAWPVISEEFNTSISNMGIVTIIISAGTIISSLNAGRIINIIGVHKVVTFSIFTTAVSLFGFSSAPSFLFICLWAIPYGLGAGCVDVTLNSFVAVNFQSKHMSWLHCMWGVGATLGPYIMGMALTGGQTFRLGYIILFTIQTFLATIIFISSKAWRIKSLKFNADKNKKSPSLKEIFKIPGVSYIAVAFFCFCAVESTVGMWAGSYLVFNRGFDPEIAAGFSALYYLGITIGRGICGFIAMKYNDKQMIRAGATIMVLGVIVLLLPLGGVVALVGLSLIGLGSAPVFPCIIHSAPENFGAKNVQAVTGVQMASAYVGILAMPALFGVVGRTIGFDLYPVFNGIILITMISIYELMLKRIKHTNHNLDKMF